MEIRIDAKEIKLYVVNEFVGNIEIPNHTIYDGQDDFGREVEIEFYNCNGICKKVDISKIVHETQNHLNEQLSEAEELAKKRNRPSGRYTIKDMWVKNIFIENNLIYVEFWWRDWVDDSRLYTSRKYKFIQCRDSDRFFAISHNPNFYF